MPKGYQHLSHEKVTRFLSENTFTAADLWKQAKTLYKSIQSDAGVIVICTSVGKAGLQIFKKLTATLAIKAPNAELSYAYPLLTIQHGDTLTDRQKETCLPQDNYW